MRIKLPFKDKYLRNIDEFNRTKGSTSAIPSCLVVNLESLINGRLSPPSRHVHSEPDFFARLGSFFMSCLSLFNRPLSTG